MLGQGWEEQTTGENIAGTSWALCQLTVHCSETTVESIFHPSESCQPGPLPTRFCLLLYFPKRKKIMSLNSMGMGIISFQLISRVLQRCPDEKGPPEPGHAVFTFYQTPCQKLDSHCGQIEKHSPSYFQNTFKKKKPAFLPLGSQRQRHRFVRTRLRICSDN